MVDLSAEQIAQRAFDLNLLDERLLQDVWGQLGSRNVPAADFTQVLLRRELLTNYQIERLIRGERSGFFYGRYKVLYQVGTGTFARVYRAVHQDDGQVMAVKVLRRRFNDQPDQREQFCREAEVGMTLRHMNIVPIFEVASDKRASYMVMEFVEGRNLREFAKVRGRFEAEEATRLVADIAAGLDYAFKRGISHRDLKMSNVLISSVGRAKLLDFGLAGADPSLSDEALASLDNPRTIDYAALERASGVRKDDNRSDIFFLGGIFYHLLAGTPPLQETKDRIQRLSRNRFFEILPLLDCAPDVPRPVAAVVAKAMQLDPRQRYQTPGEMLADLQLLQQSPGVDPVTASPEVRSAGKQHSLMIVESSLTMQNMLRDQLKKDGFRVLVTSDPQRPSNVFGGVEKPADCVIFSTGQLGEQALDAFNEFGENSSTSSIPTLLLLGPKHASWKKKARLADHRLIAGMPIKLRELRSLLQRLLEPATTASK